MRSENLYWVWLSLQLGVSSKYVGPIVERFQSPFEIYNATEEELQSFDFIPRDVADSLANKSLNKAYEIIDYCTVNSIGILSYSDEYYPSRLRSIKDPPTVLYYKGEMIDFNEKLCISIVGTRKMSEYGKKAAYKIAYELAGADIVVVSGMALGIDSVAACGAIESKGKTVAVLGCGIDIVYPKEHAKLQRIIEKNGLVLTEFSPGTRPIGINFPIRNRIISGISQGTLVVEADDKSGAIITAKNALMQGRDIYAVPGNIDESNAIGTNRLIKEGATAVISTEDILHNYEPIYANKINYSGLAYAKSVYKYSENVFDKMRIASRTYGDPPKAKELITSELRPKRKPYAETEQEKALPTTLKEKEKKKQKILRTAADKDGSEELLAQMDEKTRKIFLEMPMDRATSVEKLCALGFTVGDITTALTVLEIHGLVSALPGGLYIKR